MKYVKVTLIFESLIEEGIMDAEALRDEVKKGIEWFAPEPDTATIEILDTEEGEK